MILTIDVGNTNIVLGCFDGGKIAFTERLSTDLGKTSLEYAILFRTALDIHAVKAELIDGAIIGSVVPPVTPVIRTALRKACKVNAYILGPGLKTGLNIRMENPASVGADLIAGAVGAMEDYPCPLMVIDLGTATTMCVVDQDETFIGGMIMPGIRVSLNSLVQEASMLQGISLETPKTVIGHNTVDAMRSGIIYGNAAMIDGMIDRTEEEIGQKITVIATGGLASRVIDSCLHSIILDPELVLRGLALIYGRNKKA